jgi:tripartite-type tricarboxylate transporter receptor subunit TctC
MISGQVQMGFTATISGMPHVRSGKLKVLGMTSARRMQSFPDVPTIDEAGVPGFELINWYGLFAPAKTPAVIVAALHAEIVRALGSTDVQAAFARDGAEATPSSSPRQFAALLDKELESWQKLVKLPGFAENLK